LFRHQFDILIGTMRRLSLATILRWLWAAMPARWARLIRLGVAWITARMPRPWRARVVGLMDRLRGRSVFIGRDYAAWIGLYQQVDDTTLTAIEAEIAKFADPPMISVLLPVFNPVPDHLRDAIQSVQRQIYPHWELCIADDASTDPAIGQLLRSMQARDSRIKIVWREQNGHISAASNSALRLAAGDFIALLDHDDLISSRALYEVAARIVARPDADIIYSDEDHIDDHGRRSVPYFKPDWNPELMLGQNLISHLGVYRRALIERIGGFRLGLEGSQDYDLALRAVAQTTPDRIHHIPMVLYHWRHGTLQSSFSERAMERCLENGRRAVSEFLNHRGISSRVEPVPSAPTLTRVIFPVPVPEPLVSIIIPTRNHATMLGRCVDGLLNRTDYSPLEVLLVDNGSDQPDALALLNELVRDRRVRLLHAPGPFNYSALNNRAVREAAGSLVLLLNNDIDVINSDWLREMVSHAIRPGVGAVGAKLLYPDGTIQHGGVTVGMGGVAGHPYLNKPRDDVGYFGHLKLVRNVTAVTGACLLVRRQTFLDVGGLDETALAVALNDVDFCLRLVEAGYRNLWTPHAELYHFESASRGSDLTGEKAARFRREIAHMQQRWGKKLYNDPNWNPNLSLQTSEIALAFPPRGVAGENPNPP
jgi:glycosyltransferase involved in cell wall biosynthesis